MMPSTGCSAWKYANRGGHVFHADTELRIKWLRAVSCKDWTPSKSSALCKSHFKQSDYIAETKFGEPYFTVSIKLFLLQLLLLIANFKPMLCMCIMYMYDYSIMWMYGHCVCVL